MRKRAQVSFQKRKGRVIVPQRGMVANASFASTVFGLNSQPSYRVAAPRAFAVLYASASIFVTSRCARIIVTSI